MPRAAQRVGAAARGAVLGLVLAGSAALAGQASAAAPPPTPAPVPARAGTVTLADDSSVLGLSELADGTVNVLATEGDGTSAEGGMGGERTARLRLHHLGEAGELGAPVDLPDQRPFEVATFLPNGNLLRIAYVVGANGRVGEILLRDAGPDGTVTSSQTLPNPAHAFTGLFGDGPTGAVALRSIVETKRRHTTELRYRPAGATAFGPVLALGASPRRLSPERDPDSDGSDTTYAIAFSPSGGAAVLALPDTHAASPASLRWISPGGQIGRRISLGLHWRGSLHGSFAFDATGRLTIVLAALRDTVVPAKARGKVLAATLPEGATGAPHWQRLASATYATYERRLITVAAGDGGRVAALVGRDSHHLQLFEGQGGALRLTAALPVVFARDASLLLRDGRTTAVWDDEASDAFADEGVYLASRAPGTATFAAPRRITPAVGDTNIFPSPEGTWALSDQRIALVEREYFGDNGPVYASIVRP